MNNGSVPFPSSGTHSLRSIPSNAHYLPFFLFFALTCTPGFASVGAVSLSLALFPIVLYGYAPAAQDALKLLLPGAQTLVLILLVLLLAICGWSLVTGLGAVSFLRIFRPIYGHASGLAVVVAILALSRTEDAAARTRALCLVMMAVSLATTHFLGPRGFLDRYPGMFKHPNQLGQVASMAALFFFCQMIVCRGRKVIYPLLGMAIAGYATLLSGSKTCLSTPG